MTNRISIHAPREGCDSSSPASKTVSHADFNPRTPRGVRHWESSRDAPACDFNPRTPRGVRPHHIIDLYLCAFISIHAPREGCDAFLPRSGRPADHFNPRTPRGVRRSTVPPPLLYSNFNPRTPRGVRRAFDRGRFRAGGISIHAPREGCDAPTASERRTTWTFQSTHPARGATVGDIVVHGRVAISIHAPREGCDLSQFVDTTSRAISIHAPREGCDAVYAGTHRCHMNFNPRTPRGVRPKREAHICRVQ